MYDIRKMRARARMVRAVREGACMQVPARAARTSTCRHLHELLALRRSAASTRPAIESSTAVFQRLPCLQTRYIVERAPDASITRP